MTAIDALVSQHHLCDSFFADAESAIQTHDWETAQTKWSLFVEELLKHLDREEQILFPAFEQATGMTQGPTTVMRYEHQEMRQLLSDLQAAISQHDAVSFLGLSETLLVLMQQHNLKEENVLYPMAASRIAHLDSLLHD